MTSGAFEALRHCGNALDVVHRARGSQRVSGSPAR
jgi:hypothetical protein